MVAIGIDQYRSHEWSTLQNAVNDARGAVQAFGQLGFEQKLTLLDEGATRSAFFRLVDDLKTLSPRDSLIVFFAGHGYTERRRFADGVSARIGYLVPADADGVLLDSCVGLDAWLGELAQLPPRHILVILDCCGSGIALAPRYRLGGEGVMSKRQRGPESAVSMAPLRSLKSRRIITSALDEQPALDEGPIVGHSLFTGCLISALAGELFARLGRSAAASSELFTHIRDQIWQQSQTQQTPDFGVLDRDERGELVLEQSEAPDEPSTAAFVPGAVGAVRRRLGLADFRTPMTRVPVLAPRAAAGSSGAGHIASPGSQVGTIPIGHAPSKIPASVSPHPRRPTTASQSSLADPGQWMRPDTGPKKPTPPSLARPRTTALPRAGLEPAFVAMLDRHDAERSRGRPVVSIISADALAATTSWAMWASGHGKLTLVTDATTVDGAAAELLSAMPWLRLLQTARAQIATAAGLDLVGLDAALGEALGDDRASWLAEIASDTPAASVAGWLLSWSTAPWGSFLDPTTAPIHGPALLSAACTLAAPISILFRHDTPDVTWVSRALRTAHELASYLPHQAIAVATPPDILSRALDEITAGSMKLRRNVVPLTRVPAAASTTGGQLAQLAESALAGDLRTAGLFERNVPVPVHDRDHPISVDLFARDALLTIEIDDWYRSGNTRRYHDSRSNDTQLQHAGYYVLRFAADDIEHRRAAILDEVALALASRRISGSFMEIIK